MVRKDRLGLKKASLRTLNGDELNHVVGGAAKNGTPITTVPAPAPNPTPPPPPPPITSECSNYCSAGCPSQGCSAACGGGGSGGPTAYTGNPGDPGDPMPVFGDDDD